jgi:hypothetical protein
MFRSNVGHMARGGSSASCSPCTRTMLIGPGVPRRFLKQTGADDIASTGETEGDVQNTDRPMLRGNAS